MSIVSQLQSVAKDCKNMNFLKNIQFWAQNKYLVPKTIVFVRKIGKKLKVFFLVMLSIRQ